VNASVRPSNSAWARRCAELLIAAGFADVVVSPGSRNSPLLVAFRRSSLRVHVVVDERAAGFFALGLARASGCPVALCCTSGSALANLLPSLSEAFYSAIPLLVISADRPPRLQRRGAPQTMEQVGVFGIFGGQTLSFSADEGLPSTARFEGLFRRLSSGLPAHVNVAFDEPLFDECLASRALNLDALKPLSPPLRRWKDVDFSGLDEERGIIVCGAGAVQSLEERSLILELAERLGWPVLAEATSNLRFGPHHPALVSGYEALIRGAQLEGLEPCRVLRFGRSSCVRTLSTWLMSLDEGCLLAVGTFYEPSDAEGRMGVWVKSRSSDYCEEALKHLPRQPSRHWLASWQRLEAKAQKRLSDLPKAWWEGAVARCLVAALAPETLLHVASSMPIRDLDAFASNSGSWLKVYANRGLNGIDGTLASAAGEGRAHGQTPMVVLIGDLAFLYDASSLPLLQNLNATVVVVDNAGGGIFAHLPAARELPNDEFEELLLTPPQIDPLQVALGYGARCVEVSNLDEFETQLGRELKTSGLGVIVARVERGQNLACHERAWLHLTALDGATT
jgi:2-succinyl-5-enolpyruvyl-6-hydroxy-3-cyclohexene-1-carboxylate synthase